MRLNWTVSIMNRMRVGYRIARQDDYLVETRIMARNIKEAPIPDIIVKVSPKKRNEIVIATIGSVNRMTVEVTGEMYLNPLSHK